ncbi:hypothetical protein [Brevundimonas sp. GCM10030266]|uniref:hypothetical protein n=1 Tax=Brevundimonas sp. GCM10030266 TaxID=3273386 RepID=UPI003607FEF0
MDNSDPVTCRRALREIAEIAAVARLQDSQMSGQEALAAISAIADWVIDTAPRAETVCSDIVTRIDAVTQGVDVDNLDDENASRMFATVVRLLGAKV